MLETGTKLVCREQLNPHDGITPSCHRRSTEPFTTSGRLGRPFPSKFTMRETAIALQYRKRCRRTNLGFAPQALFHFDDRYASLGGARASAARARLVSSKRSSGCARLQSRAPLHATGLQARKSATCAHQLRRRLRFIREERRLDSQPRVAAGSIHSRAVKTKMRNYPRERRPA
jgi:hypothetical protein